MTRQLTNQKYGLLKAFTLVELLVVIAIIALLLSILLPSLQKARMVAQGVTCGEGAKHQAVAVRMYAMDNRGRLPSMLDYPTAIRKYMGVSTKKGGGDDVAGGADSYSQWFKCAGQPTRVPGLSSKSVVGQYSYGVNYFMVFSVPDWAKTETLGSGKWYTVEMGKSRILDNVPNTTYMVADAHLGWIFTPVLWTFQLDLDKTVSSSDDCAYDSYWFKNTTFDVRNPKATPEWWYNGFAPRHINKSGNFMFSDGSVRRRSLKDFIQNKNNIWGDRDPTKP